MPHDCRCLDGDPGNISKFGYVYYHVSLARGPSIADQTRRDLVLVSCEKVSFVLHGNFFLRHILVVIVGIYLSWAVSALRRFSVLM